MDTIIIYVIVAGMLGGGILLTPKHKVNTGVDLCYCMKQGHSEFECKSDAMAGIKVSKAEKAGEAYQSCAVSVAAMTKAELMEYIRDDETSMYADNGDVISVDDEDGTLTIEIVEDLL